MSYYARNKVLNKRLPAFVGFFVLLFALGITLLLSGNTFIFISKATVGADPKNVQVSNISDTSFTISYITDAPAAGTISYGTDPSTPTIALDDRDQQSSGATEHQVHFITVKNLLPATKYYFVIDSGSQKVNNNGNPFVITTAASLPAQSAGQQNLLGTVALSDGSIPSEAVVYLTSDTTQQLATVINPDGSYQLPLANLRDSTLNAAATLSSDTVLQLQVVTPTDQSTIKILANQTNHVPKIVLSQNYDFTLGTSELSSGSAQVASISAFPVFTTPAPVSSPEITSPTDAQAYKDQQPLFEGRALPNTEVDITIQSQQEISAKLQSDGSGSWQFRPPISLAPGKHTITLKSVDASGVVQTIERSFTVYASGSQFIEPSVSPILPPTVVPTAIPTSAPTPTAALTPTPAPTTAVTQTIQPTVATTPVPLPKTGSSAVVTGIIAGIATVGIGALLFLLSVV